MIIEWLLLIPLFFIIALIYSSAGFGGGSSYLALLSLFTFDFEVIKCIALCCNIVVVLGSCMLFYKKGFLKIPKIFPLIVLSVPLAYFGGSLRLEEKSFFLILGITLILASIFMWIEADRLKTKNPISNNVKLNALLGGGIGFLSGLVGIGGGIFLSPLLHIIKWDKAKLIAATSSLFILVNSIAGLTGQLLQSEIIINWNLVFYLVVAVFIGGQIGSRITINYLSNSVLKRVTSVLIAIVGIRLLLNLYF